ncbi:hypothetical protein KSX_76510 [Ktedonospora formicarum]|uniref:Uncharacterized protein n=1 Tax=Ktedonospora formicarum TaxID=2778364 RepID=A0A8J3IBZ2_9CHLR|nr:hypothetical protein KSX_76510 [Ktedonospora formicarum]
MQQPPEQIAVFYVLFHVYKTMHAMDMRYSIGNFYSAITYSSTIHLRGDEIRVHYRDTFA